MKIEKNSTIVMIGDSITNAFRTEPVGEGPGLGTGYVYQVDSLLGAVYPERNIRVLNTGTSGHAVRDLKPRWQRDVFDLKPNWVSCMIGANDVWRQFDAVKTPEAAVLPNEYESTYSELIGMTRPKLDGMVLMTPFYCEPNRREPMRKRMDEYGDIVKRLAKQHDCILVDTQAEFDKACESVYPGTLAGDRVHPSMYGTAILTRAFLKAVDFDF